MSFFDDIMSLLKGGGKKKHSLDGESETAGSHEEHIEISQESSSSAGGDLKENILESFSKDKPKRIATSSEKKKKVMMNNILVLGGIGSFFLIFSLFQGKGEQEQTTNTSRGKEVVISLKDQVLDDQTVYRKLMEDISKLTSNQESILRQLKLNDERLNYLDNKFKESNASIYSLFNKMNTAITSLNRKIDDVGNSVERVNKRVDDVQNNVSVISSSQPVMVGGGVGGAMPEAPKLVLPENSLETEIKKAKEALKRVIGGGEQPRKKEDKGIGSVKKLTINGGIYGNSSGNKNTAQNVYVNEHGKKVIKNIDPKKYSINREKGKVLPGFVKVVLLTGVAANTSNNAASNPMPVLMRVQGNLTMAGDAQYRMKSCFVLGSATGSVSDMRAHIRLANISCVDKENNRILEGPLKGYVVDSDGQFGLRGIYVERRAEAIKKMFMSGFLQGLGSVIANAGSAATANGDNASGINLGIAGQTSAAQGFTSALNKLVEFYMKEVQTMFPVIEVKSGRVATLVVTAPQVLRWKDAKSDLVEKKVKSFMGR